MIRETVADYKKAIVAVAIAGGVGATVAGAGLLAYRLWRRRFRNLRDTKAIKQADPTLAVSKTLPTTWWRFLLYITVAKGKSEGSMRAIAIAYGVLECEKRY